MPLLMLLSVLALIFAAMSAQAGLPREISCMAPFMPARTTPLPKNNVPMIKREAIGRQFQTSSHQQPLIAAEIVHEGPSATSITVKVGATSPMAVAAPLALSIAPASIPGVFFVGLRDGQVQILRAGAELIFLPLPEKPRFSDRTTPLSPRDEHDMNLSAEAATHVEFLEEANGSPSPTLPNFMVVRANGRVDYYRLTQDHWTLLVNH
jgi:hypothetical protein